MALTVGDWSPCFMRATRAVSPSGAGVRLGVTSVVIRHSRVESSLTVLTWRGLVGSAPLSSALRRLRERLAVGRCIREEREGETDRVEIGPALSARQG